VGETKRDEEWSGAEATWLRAFAATVEVRLISEARGGHVGGGGEGRLIGQDAGALNLRY
jgi:hypothetical protein